MAQETQGSRKQRSFLGVFDRLLKALQMDYARFDRFESSGYAEFAGKLYTLNSNMFQNHAFCDRMLTQMILHYITWFQDPGLQLVVGPGAAWHVSQDFGTQRLGDELYVTWATPEAPVQVGERIVGASGKSLAELRPEVERTLWTTVEPADPEREDWSVVLAFARDLRVVGLDGQERTVKIDQTAGDSDWARPVGSTAKGKQGAQAGGEAGAGEDEGAASEGAAGAGEDAGAAGAGAEGEGAPVGTLVGEGAATAAEGQAAEQYALVGDVGVLALRNAASETFAEEFAQALAEAEKATNLVIDVRGCRGGTQEDIYALIPLVLGPGCTATPEQLFGKPGIAMNYSRHNADDKLAELASLRAQLQGKDGATEADAATLESIDAYEAELSEKRGKGVLREMTSAEEFYPEATFKGAVGQDRHVVVLCDRFTGEAAEWLVRAAKSAGFACVMGRATLGSLDNTCPRAVRLDEDLTLIIPTATYVAALDGGATLGRGIEPDVHLAWSPEQLTHDVELDAACARALS